MKKGLLIILGCTLSIALFAQVGIGTSTPNPAAQLDITSTSKGLLLPRLTTAQRDAIVNPPAGLFIYNSTLNKFQGCLNVYGTSNPKTTNYGDAPVMPAQEIMPGMMTPAYNGAQSFTAVSETLAGVEIDVASIRTAGTYTLTIYAGAGVGGSVLLTQTVTISTAGLTTLYLNTILALVINQSYTFELASITGGLNWNATPGDAYTGGNAYQNMNASGHDFCFKTISSGLWVDLNL